MAENQKIIAQVRSFNRFYTNIIGLLDQRFLDTPLSLTEGRVLYEISQMEECSAKKIRQNIDIDEGYLSRIIHKFIKHGLVKKVPSTEDKRLHHILLTEKGKREFSKLNENSNKLISQLMEKLSETEQKELVGMMQGIHALLSRP